MEHSSSLASYSTCFEVVEKPGVEDSKHFLRLTRFEVWGSFLHQTNSKKKKKETNFSTEETNSSPNSVTKVLELAKTHDESSHFASSWNRGEGRGLGQKSSFSYLNHINHT